MPSPLEFRSLPVTEHLQLVGAIWDSIAEDQHTLPDHPSVIKEVRERKARYLSNPKSGVTWENAKMVLLAEMTGKVYPASDEHRD